MADIWFAAPYPGLHAFEPAQSDLFFGREQEVRQLIARLCAQRLVGVVGASGSGKSSLVRAGLIPRLPQGYTRDVGKDWRIVTLTPGNEPMTVLARKLADCFRLAEKSVAETLGRSSRGLVQFAVDKLNGASLFILVDQFEELMRYGADADPQRKEAAEFVDLLLGATGHGPFEPEGDKKPPIYIVLTMRSEFLGKCTRFPGLAEALNDGQFLVPRLERNQLKLAIEGPAAMVGGRVAPALTQRLLNDAAGEVDQLPLLQFALARMWEISAQDRLRGASLDLTHYEAIGGSIVKALNRAADDSVRKLTQKNVRNGDIIRRMFQRLAEPGTADEEVRRPAPLSELAAVAECPESELTPLVEKFLADGFVTQSRDDDPEIDITHESLIRRWSTLNIWVQDEERSADIYRRLADAAAHERSLYRGRDLAEALRWRELDRPSEAWATRYPVENGSYADAMTFLNRSRRRRLISSCLAWMAAGVVAVTISLGVTFMHLSEQHAQTVAVDRLSLQAQNLANGPSNLTQKSLLLGLAALKLQPSAHIDRLVREQSANLPIFKVSMQHAGAVTGLTFSEDGKQLVSASEDKTLRLWDVAKGVELSRATLDRPIQAIRYDRAGGYVAALAYDDSHSSEARMLSLWKVQDGKLMGPLFEQQFPHSPVAFSLRDHELWIADGSNLLSLRIDAVGEGVQSTELKVERPTFSPDGKHLLAISGRTVLAHNLETATTSSFEVPEQFKEPISILVSDDGQYVGVTGNVLKSDHTVSRRFQQWRLNTTAKVGRELTLKGDALTLGVGGKFLVTSNAFSGTSVIDTSNGQEVGTIHEGEASDQGDGRFWRIGAFSHDDTRIALLSRRSAVRIFARKPWREVGRIGLGVNFSKFAWSPDDGTIATGAETGLITIWALSQQDGLLPIRTSRLFALSPSARYSVSSPTESRVELRNSENRTVLRFDSHGNYAFSADERLFAWIDRASETTSLYALPYGQLVCTFNIPSEPVKAAFRRADALIMVTSDGYLRSWSTDACQPNTSARLGKFEKGVFDDPPFQWQVYFSSDGTRLALNLKDDIDNMALWDTDAGKLLSVVPAMTFWSVSFSPNGSLVAGMAAGGITVWRVSSGKALWNQPVDALNWSPRFDPTGRKLAGSAGHAARIWESESGRILLEENDDAAIAHGASFDRTGDFFASAWTGRVKVWDIRTGAQVNDIPIRASSDQPFLAFTPDNTALIVEDATLPDALRTLPWRPDDVVREACRHIAFNLSATDWTRLGGYYVPTKPTCPDLPPLQ